MYKQDLALNKLQGLIYHKTQPTNLLSGFFFLNMVRSFKKQASYFSSCNLPNVIVIELAISTYITRAISTNFSETATALTAGAVEITAPLERGKNHSSQ